METRNPWRPVIGMALAVGLVYLSIFSVPPLISTFVDDMGFTHAETGAMMSVCLAAFLVGSLISGRAARRFGTVPLVVGSLLMCAAATACFGITASLGPMLAARVFVGLAGGLIYAPGVTLVTSLLPPAKANLGVGIFLCGLSVGGTVAYFATRLLSDSLSWRWPSWIFAGVILVGAAVVAGLAGSASPAAPTAGDVKGPSLRRLFANHPFRMLVPTLFLGLFVAYGVFTWIPPYLDESAGFSTAQISLISALTTLAGIPATFGMGWLAYRSGRPLAVAGAGMAVPALMVVFAMTSSPSPATAAVVSIAAAFGVSGGLGPLYALPPILFGAVAGATASGIAAAAAMGGAVTSTYLGGWIIGDTGYSEAFWIYAGAAAVTAGCFIPMVARRLRAPSPAAEAVPGTPRAG